MKPIEFPEANKTWAADQPQYLPLPSYSDHDQTITCWRLTWRERFVLFFRGVLWLHQLNFGEPLQPQRPRVENPFQEVSE